ncbi:MAG TPA: SDR family oxidoreductase, partial [Streptosporangiaceae bacterium]|nr:SDR family oxidoreductase [Streptosporangiaceae bacterium]
MTAGQRRKGDRGWRCWCAAGSYPRPQTATSSWARRQDGAPAAHPACGSGRRRRRKLHRSVPPAKTADGQPQATASAFHSGAHFPSNQTPTAHRSRPRTPIETVRDQEWDAARRDEVDLVFYLTRPAWPHLKASRGVVVNMASLNGCLSFKLLPSLAHATNKTAIIGMTRQLALEGSEHGIRVNSISPGFIETNSTRGELEDEEFGRQMRDRTL